MLRFESRVFFFCFRFIFRELSSLFIETVLRSRYENAIPIFNNENTLKILPETNIKIYIYNFLIDS